jgi:hypothetical protein
MAVSAALTKPRTKRDTKYSYSSPPDPMVATQPMKGTSAPRIGGMNDPA